MSITAETICESFHAAGIPHKLVGSPEAVAERITPPPGDTGSVIFIERPKDVFVAGNLAATVSILPVECLTDMVAASDRALIGVEDVRRTMPVLLGLFNRRPTPPPGIHPTAAVSRKAHIGKNVSIGAYAVIGDDCRIGEDAIIDAHVTIGGGSTVGACTKIYPGARVYDGVRIGDRCIIHSGAVIGSDGYGFVSTPEGHHKVPQIGGVVIEDDVELGANVTIDRGTIGDTVIGRGTKLDNLVHLAHNVRLGPHCMLIAQTGIAGSTTVGMGVVLAAQSGVAGHIEIGDRAMIGARTGVTKSIPGGQSYSGFPARLHPEEKRIKAVFGRLPDMVRDVARLRAAVLRLSRRLSSVESHPSILCSTR